MQSVAAWVRERFHPLYRLRRSAIFRLLGRRLSFTAWRNFRGRRVYADSYRNMSFLLLPNLPEHDRFARIVCAVKPASFWDVGANIGLYTWIVLSERPGVKTVLFEPDPGNMACLRKTGAGTDVRLVERAVADRAGKNVFLLDQLSGATGSLVLGRDGHTFNQRHHSVGGPAVTVQCTTLDESCAAYGPPDLLKIDVEGADLLVLRGGMETLRAHRPAILLEASEDRPEIMALLRGIDYELFDPETWGSVGDKDGDILAVHSSRKSSFQSRSG